MYSGVSTATQPSRDALTPRASQLVLARRCLQDARERRRVRRHRQPGLPHATSAADFLDPPRSTTTSSNQTTPGMPMGRAGIKQPSYRSVKRHISEPAVHRVVVFSESRCTASGASAKRTRRCASAFIHVDRENRPRKCVCACHPRIGREHRQRCSADAHHSAACRRRMLEDMRARPD